MDRSPVLWLDDRLLPVDDAHLSPLDHGLTVGDGVFETLKVLRGEPFALTRHLRRLRRSAAGLGLEVPRSDDELRAAAASVIAANGLGAGPAVDAPAATGDAPPEGGASVDQAPIGRLRITVTGGIGPAGSDRGDAPPTVLITAGPSAPAPTTVDVVTVPWRRNEHSAVAGLKTTSYAENVVALARARAAGADEAIFANTAGDLCEGTGSNVFGVHDGRLLTPPLSSGCLAGITRELLAEVVEVEERPLPLDALARADEAFLTSSTRDVVPIARVDGRPLPRAPGPVTAACAEAFTALAARDLDP